MSSSHKDAKKAEHNSTILSKDKCKDKPGSHQRLLRKRQLERSRYLERANIIRQPQVNHSTPAFNFTPSIPLEDLRTQGILKRRTSLTSAKFRETKQRILREEINVIGAIKILADKVKASEEKTLGIWKSLPSLVHTGQTTRPILRSATYRSLVKLDKTHDDENDVDDNDGGSSSSSSDLSSVYGDARQWGRRSKGIPGYDAEDQDISLMFRTTLPPLVTKPNDQ